MDITGILESIQQIFTDFGFKILSAIAIAVIGFWIAKKISAFAGKAFERMELDPTLHRFFSNLIYWLLLGFVIIAALGALGINTGAFMAILGAAGLAIGLAMEGSLSNFAAGVLIILFRPFKVGDYIEVDENEGKVEKIQLFHSTLVTYDNETIIIPNSEITGNVITNYSTKEWVRVEIPLTVSHGADFNKVKEIMMEVATHSGRALNEPPAEVQVTSMTENGLEMQLEVTVMPIDREDVVFEISDLIFPYSWRSLAKRQSLNQRLRKQSIGLTIWEPPLVVSTPS